MPFVITDPCIDTKDTSCVDVCPVDCIHPRKDDAEIAQAMMLFIHPEECIDCGACVPACPVAAIYESVDVTPSSQRDLIEANAAYRQGAAAAMAEADALVKAHVAAQPELMSLPASERQAAHARF
jgi:ferredoxin